MKTKKLGIFGSLLCSICFVYWTLFSGNNPHGDEYKLINNPANFTDQASTAKLAISESNFSPSITTTSTVDFRLTDCATYTDPHSKKQNRTPKPTTPLNFHAKSIDEAIKNINSEAHRKLLLEANSTPSEPIGRLNQKFNGEARSEESTDLERKLSAILYEKSSVRPQINILSVLCKRSICETQAFVYSESPSIEWWDFLTSIQDDDIWKKFQGESTVFSDENGILTALTYLRTLCKNPSNPCYRGRASEGKIVP